MQRGNPVRRILTVLAVLGGLAATSAAGAPGGNTVVPGKAGGVLNVLTREDLTEGFSIHESVTISTIWPAEPCFNNLVMFDPVKPLEGLDTVVPELAERWSWQDGYRNLVFFLRRGVKWHDGQPFSARDVSSPSTWWEAPTNFVKAVLHGAGVPGAALAPRPIGFWGLAGPDVDTASDKPRAKQLLAAAGYLFPRHTAYNYGRMQEVWRDQ